MKRQFATVNPLVNALIATVLLVAINSGAAVAQDKPNIVLVFMDNFGWGEPGFNGGGIIRGAATPRLDQLAEGRPPIDELQCRSPMHAIALRHHDGSICNS